MTRPGRRWIIHAIVGIASGIWCLSFMAVPFLQEGGPAARKAAALLTLFFHPVCHQAPERCFSLNGHPLAVCSRCSGIYLGFFLGVFLHPILAGLVRPNLRFLFIVSWIPAGIHRIISWLHWAPDSLWLRAVVGLPIGSVAALLVLDAVWNGNFKK